MASTLLDRLQKQMGTKDTAKFSDNARRAADLLRSKQTGKAVGAGTGPGASSLAEKSAVAQTQAQLDQGAQKGRVAAEQLGAQEQASTEAANRAQQGAQLENLGQRQEQQRTEDRILQDYETGVKKLQGAQAIADMEQVGQQARLENKQYLDTLQRVGARERLDDDLKFSEDIQKDIFSDMRDLTRDSLAFQELMAIEDNKFAEFLSDMDINYALQIASQEQDIASTRAKTEAAGQVVSAGAKYYADKQAEKKKDNK